MMREELTAPAWLIVRRSLNVARASGHISSPEYEATMREIMGDEWWKWELDA